jgi:hypothetical protein
MVRARTKPDWFRLGIHRPRAYQRGGRSISPGAVSPISWRIWRIQSPGTKRYAQMAGRLGRPLSAGMSSSGHCASTIATEFVNGICWDAFWANVSRDVLSGDEAQEG